MIFFQNDPNYQSGDAVDWNAERERQQEAYGIQRTYTTEINNDGQSLEGYKKAWESLSNKLEAGKDEYVFLSENKYVRASQILENNQNNEENIDLFGRGMELFQEGKIREAVLVFEANVQEDKENSEAWRMLGRE